MVKGLILIYKLIKILCSKCKSYFENSETSCISSIHIQDKLSLLLKPSTKLEVKITRKIHSFCHSTKNSFWILYYRISQSKIYFSCAKCNKSNLCEEYILSRIIKHIKAFDITKESKVFKKVREELTKKDLESTALASPNLETPKLDKNSKEVVNHYVNKIKDEYSQRAFDFESGIALIENASVEQDREIKNLIEKRVYRYRVYKAKIILKNLIVEALESDKKLKEPMLIELFYKEKFLNYIRQVIESRFIDFTRSPKYKNETTQEIEKSEKERSSIEDIDTILESLSNEQKIIYKLKYAIRLDNREFLHITYKMNYLDKSLVESFTPSEKLYIKFSVHYEIEDDSTHFSMIDVKQVKESISKKISYHRETIESRSYIEDKEEIYIKLIYTEPLSAKEMGIVFNLTSKQIDKKVENIKKRLKRL